MGNKIATQLIDSVTGERYYIGTVGAVENVAVKLSAPTSEDWASYKVIVQDITDGANNGEYQLNALGETRFFIPMGHTYSVTLPTIGDYTMPLIITLTAQLASRIITHEYSMDEVQYEQINISALVVNGDVSMLNGRLVVAKAESGNVYVEEFANGKITMRIPYGEKCKLTLPDVEGWWRDGANIQFTTGLPSRDMLIHYSEIPIGFFGIDDDGNRYTEEQVQAMVDNGEDTSIIHYIGYNDAALAIADRGDGTTGCGFMFKIPHTNVSQAWASSNVEFDDPDTEEKDLPFRSSLDLAAKDCASSTNTTKIIAIGEKLGIATPAATYCRSQSIVVGGIERSGNLPAFGVIYRASHNRAKLGVLCSLLGKTAPSIHSGNWWTSCQGNATYAVYLDNGGFFNNRKTYSYNVLCCFDL